MENTINSIVEKITNAKTIAIVCHNNPDGDTLGGGLALYKSLINLNKEAFVFCENGPSSKMSFMPLLDVINIKSLSEYDLSISVDCADFKTIGLPVEEFLKGKTKINIDHHKTNTRYADINFIKGSAANCENVFELLEQLNEECECIDDTIAQLLYIGLITDSGNFSFSSVNSSTMSIASKLLKYNFNASKLSYILTKSKSKQSFDLHTKVLAKTRFFDENKIAIITFFEQDFEQTNTTSAETEGCINEALNVNGVQIAVAITQLNEQNYKVSFRTKEQIDASIMAGIFGGGGHKNAAGCRVNGFYEDVIDKILKICRDML
ncbi:MAG: DHH family phosphoesterase [Clostridia bacterium]